MYGSADKRILYAKKQEFSSVSKSQPPGISRKNAGIRACMRIIFGCLRWLVMYQRRCAAANEIASDRIGLDIQALIW